ncbi:unnamed protein product, partial [Cyprideis torosa]
TAFVLSCLRPLRLPSSCPAFVLSCLRPVLPSSSQTAFVLSCLTVQGDQLQSRRCENYVKGVSALEELLALERLRQAVAAREAAQKAGLAQALDGRGHLDASASKGVVSQSWKRKYGWFLGLTHTSLSEKVELTAVGAGEGNGVLFPGGVGFVRVPVGGLQGRVGSAPHERIASLNLDGPYPRAN